MRRTVVTLTAALAVAGLASAQAPQQRVPRETVSANVGGKKVEISYGRPALKGRTLADLTKQLPEDRIWRAGENEVTTLKSEGDLMIGNKKAPAGSYSVYVHIPESGDWALVLNTDPGIELSKLVPNRQFPPERASLRWPRLDGYTKNVADKEVVRAAMKPGAVSAPADAFTFALVEGEAGATLTMSWADKSYSIELKPAK